MATRRWSELGELSPLDRARNKAAHAAVARAIAATSSHSDDEDDDDDTAPSVSRFSYLGEVARATVGGLTVPASTTNLPHGARVERAGDGETMVVIVPILRARRFHTVGRLLLGLGAILIARFAFLVVERLRERGRL